MVWQRRRVNSLAVVLTTDFWGAIKTGVFRVWWWIGQIIKCSGCLPPVFLANVGMVPPRYFLLDPFQIDMSPESSEISIP